MVKNLGKYSAINIGTWQGYSVLEIVKAFEKVAGVNLSYKVVDRREGDVESIYGDASLANDQLDWTAEFGIEDMMLDA